MARQLSSAGTWTNVDNFCLMFVLRLIYSHTEGKENMIKADFVALYCAGRRDSTTLHNFPFLSPQKIIAVSVGLLLLLLSFVFLLNSFFCFSSSFFRFSSTFFRFSSSCLRFSSSSFFRFFFLLFLFPLYFCYERILNEINGIKMGRLARLFS